jgi:prevent-host-death family protein
VPTLAKAIKVPVDSLTTTMILKFRRKLGVFQQRARCKPVEITRHGRRACVLMSTEHYDWMQAAGWRTCRTSDTAAVVIDAVKRATMRPEHEPLDELLK